MRPRVFPAEDFPHPRRFFRQLPASMRPRVFPAEDLPVCVDVAEKRPRASMRPRVFPAEDAAILFTSGTNDELQ